MGKMVTGGEKKTFTPEKEMRKYILLFSYFVTIDAYV